MVLQISSDIDINSLCSIVGAIDSSQHFQPHHLGYMDSTSLSEIGNSSTITLCGTKWKVLTKQQSYITHGINTYNLILVYLLN